ncbi:MAG: hemerythrin domain-containing protein [Paludibacter sp.]|jgi:hemerythrin-like domain-containing protein|nr:hemerythrin domain-containing protein [Paludibacter sp.]
MKTATQNLEHDHVYILQLTEIMQAMVEKEVNNIEHFELVVNLIRKFADGIHHAKEEDLLFPKMGEKGFSPVQGPVAVMLSEHVQGRNYVQGMIDGIEMLRQDDSEGLEVIYDNMDGYAELLQNHIAKENGVLFRMADQVLSDDEQSSLLIQFDEVEAEVTGEFSTASSIAKITELAALYL